MDDIELNRINQDAMDYEDQQMERRGRQNFKTDRNKHANDSLNLHRSKSRSKSPIDRNMNPLEYEPERLKDLDYHKQKNQKQQVKLEREQKDHLSGKQHFDNKFNINSTFHTTNN